MSGRKVKPKRKITQVEEFISRSERIGQAAGPIAILFASADKAIAPETIVKHFITCDMNGIHNPEDLSFYFADISDLAGQYRDEFKNYFWIKQRVCTNSITPFSIFTEEKISSYKGLETQAPAIILTIDDKTNSLKLQDGTHRFLAAKARNEESIDAYVGLSIVRIKSWLMDSDPQTFIQMLRATVGRSALSRLIILLNSNVHGDEITSEAKSFAKGLLSGNDFLKWFNIEIPPSSELDSLRLFVNLSLPPIRQDLEDLVTGKIHKSSQALKQLSKTLIRLNDHYRTSDREWEDLVKLNDVKTLLDLRIRRTKLMIDDLKIALANLAPRNLNSA